MSRKPDPSAAVARILNAPRRHTDHVVGVVDGKIAVIARLTWSLPKDGMGPLRVAVWSWGPDGGAACDGPQVGSASGCGYDKETAALTGLTIGGVELGDHCDHRGRPRLETVCHERGWCWVRGR